MSAPDNIATDVHIKELSRRLKDIVLAIDAAEKKNPRVKPAVIVGLPLGRKKLIQTARVPFGGMARMGLGEKDVPDIMRMRYCVKLRTRIKRRLIVETGKTIQAVEEFCRQVTQQKEQQDTQELLSAAGLDERPDERDSPHPSAIPRNPKLTGAKLAIAKTLESDPMASDKRICIFLDKMNENDLAPIPDSWTKVAPLRLWSEALENPKLSARVHTYISKVRRQVGATKNIS